MSGCHPEIVKRRPSHNERPRRIVYAVSGRGAIASLDENGEEQRQVLSAGDWALIPANREHKEVNDGDEEVVWVIVRAPGGVPEVVNLTGWKGQVVG